MLRPTQQITPRMPRATPRRAAFTLVEVLVVIAIISILVSLITAAVLSTLRKVEDVYTGNDINQISTALTGFKTHFPKYPPSCILLANSRAAYDPQGDALDPLREYSLRYLGALWPELNWNSGIDWSGGDPTFTAAILEGDQCLLFFLAGMQYPAGSAVGGVGFSNNPANPTQFGGTRMGPYLQNLDPDRLVATRSGNPFPSYMDGYRRVGSSPKPYMYFSAGLRKNGYDAGDLTTYGGTPYYGMRPFIQTNGQYFNSDSYQIISAGRDQRFGSGGVWNPSDAPSYVLVSPDGADDLANFSGGPMGVSK